MRSQAVNHFRDYKPKIKRNTDGKNGVVAWRRMRMTLMMAVFVFSSGVVRVAVFHKLNQSENFKTDDNRIFPAISRPRKCKRIRGGDICCKWRC